MSRSRPAVADVFSYPGTGPSKRPWLTHIAVWALTVDGDAIVVPIGSPVGNFPTVLVSDLKQGVLRHTSCLLVDQTKLTPAKELAAAILGGSRPYVDTCTREFKQKVLASLRHPALPRYVRKKLP